MRYSFLLFLIFSFFNLAKADDQTFRFIYAYDGNHPPKYYHVKEYANKIWGYSIKIPTKFRNGIINSETTWGIMITPPLSNRYNGFQMGEFFNITGFGPVGDLKQQCENQKNFMLKSRNSRSVKLKQYILQKDYCQIEVEGYLGNEAYVSLTYLTHNGNKGVSISMQFPPILESLYKKMLKDTVASLRWNFSSKKSKARLKQSDTISNSYPNNNVNANIEDTANNLTYKTDEINTHASKNIETRFNMNSKKIKWAKGYDNHAWGIHLRFPAGFFIEPPLKTKDYGVIFLSDDKQSILYISWAKTSASIKQIYKYSLQKIRQNPNLYLTYNRIHNNWFVISSINRANQTISYMKGYKSNGNFYLYLLTYPKTQKYRYDDLILKLNRQFGYHKHKQKYIHHRIKHRISAQKCDALARACYAECPDNDNGVCLDNCETRRDRCYGTGRW